jgi:DNA helicase-2/ATP-dependent DNA helicase PcrA
MKVESFRPVHPAPFTVYLPAVSSHLADSFASLNPAQREAVEHVTGPVLVVAGAGSGKTRVLTLRIARLIEEHGVPPERILAVTFTNKAAGEMKERVGRLLDRDPSGLWIGTFHSLSARLLRREAEHLGFDRQFTIYDEDDRSALIGRILERLGHDRKKFTPRAVGSIVSAAKNRMTTAAELKASAPFDRFVQVAADVLEQLPAELQARNAMDFDDLLLHPVRLFHERPDRLAEWQERFSFVLVDEFQDTNVAQYRLVRFLGKPGNVFAVGDDDQSIYGWRGADVRNMQEFQRDFPGTRIIRLEENYRSTGVVLDAANAVIAENRGRIGKTLRTTRRGGEAVTVVAAADERDEAEWVVRELGARRNDAEWTDMAILYRTNSQSRAFEEALRRAGTPYRIVGAISFYDRREVKDLLAYLRLVANPADDEAFLRAINVPKRGIGETSLAQVQDAARQRTQSLLALARHGDTVPGLRPNVRTGLMAFAAIVDRVAAASADHAPVQVLESLIEMIGYEQALMAEGPEGADRWENVRELVAGAAEWSEEVAEEAEGTPLQRFLAEAALLSGSEKISGSAEGVTLMTLHTAKGLEWPIVVMAGMEDGLFPLARAEEKEDGIEEERRLAYVGITRARDKLFLTWARSRRRGGQLLPGIRSRFLQALPPGTIEEKRTNALGAFGGWRGDAGARGRGAAAWGEGKSGFGWLDDDPGPAAARRPSTPAPAENDDAPRYVKGERVKHRKFGSGVIQGLAGAGRDLKVTVRFDDDEAGLKQLLVAYAGLERDRDWESA